LNVNYEVISHICASSPIPSTAMAAGRTSLTGPDVIVKPNWYSFRFTSGSGIGGFEYQATPELHGLRYYGGAYFQRNFGFLAAPPTSSCDGVSGFTAWAWFPRIGEHVEPGHLRSTSRDPHAVVESELRTAAIITQYSYLVRSPCRSSPRLAEPQERATQYGVIWPSLYIA